MAAAKEYGRRGKKKRRIRSILCFLGSCFGVSNKESADDHHHDKSRVEVNNNHTCPTSEIICCSSTEIHHLVEAKVDQTSQLLAPAPAHEVIINDHKRDDMIVEKSKKLNNRRSNWTKLSHSVPILSGQKKEKMEGMAKGKKGKEIIIAGEFDPNIVGALVLMVTLIVMLIWGKLCAIICTAAWFYVIPRRRLRPKNSIMINDDHDDEATFNNIAHIDFDSREYKKNAVLQGLLHRNHHYF